MNKKSLKKAANKAVTENRRGMVWPVYRSYSAEYDDLERWPRLVAPEPEPRFGPVHDDKGYSVANEGSPVQGFRDMDFGIKHQYAPLQHPEIVLRLAEIGDSRRSGPLTLEKMRTWAETWGLLGIRDETGCAETLTDFGAAAQNVARTLRLYEAASANYGEGDRDKLRGLFQTNTGGALVALRERAMDEVEMNVSEALRARTYHAQYRLRDKGRTVGFDEGHGFHDLLGAVYLHLSYLIRDPASRRCIVCQKFLDPNKYADSKYCDDGCKQKAYRDRTKKQARTDTT